MFQIDDFVRFFLLSENRDSNTHILICEDFLILDASQKILDDVDLFLYSSIACRNAVKEFDSKIFDTRNVTIGLDVFWEIKEENDIELTGFADAMPAMFVNVADSTGWVVILKMTEEIDRFFIQKLTYFELYQILSSQETRQVKNAKSLMSSLFSFFEAYLYLRE